MKVVVDTNVLVSAYLSLHGAPARIFQYYYQKDSFDLITSEAILSEYLRALSYPKVQKHHRMNNKEVSKIIDNIRHVSYVVKPNISIHLQLSDRDDVMFFECACASKAQYIISGDKLVQEVGEYKGIQVVSPRMFLSVLENE